MRTPPLPLVQLHELAMLVHGPEIPVMHQRYRDAAAHVAPETIRAAVDAGNEAIAELETPDTVGVIGVDGAIDIVFVEPSDAPPPEAGIGLALRGFTTEDPGKIYIVHPYGTRDVRTVVRHEVYHLWYAALHHESAAAPGKHYGPSEAGAREFAGDDEPTPIEWGEQLRRAYAVDHHPDERRTLGLATVVIDGSSNMFKIAATGTFSLAVASPGSGAADVTLIGLGALPTTPAHLSFVAAGNSVGEAQNLGSMVLSPVTDTWAAATLNGAAVRQFLALTGYAAVETHLNGSSQAVVRLAGYISGVAADTFYARYYILKEAAL